MVLDPKMIYRIQYKRFKKLEQVNDKFHRKSGTKVYNLPGFEILSKSINMVRYVLKFGYMRCSGLRCKVDEGFVGFQLDL